MSVRPKLNTKRIVIVLALAGIALLCRSCTKPELLAEFFDSSHDDNLRIVLVKRSVLFPGKIWDMRIEVYSGKLLIGIQNVIKSRDSRGGFPEFTNFDYSEKTQVMTMDFERDGKCYRLSFFIDDGEYNVWDYINDGRAVQVEKTKA